ncbi:MAG: hypothetical protein IPM29_07800 [Planctomycetes bacterium]|nr:hypothetical protein [Planctomycetota bacterium]
MQSDDAMLVVRVLLASGAVHAFAERDPRRIGDVLDSFEPERVFERDALMIVGEHGVTTFRTRAVRRVELHGANLPRWSHGPGFERLEQIDARAFEVGRRHVETGKAQAGRSYARLEDSNGDLLFVECVGAAGARSGRIERLLDRPVLQLRRGDDRVLLINTEHVESIAVFPGPSERPSETLALEPTP